MALSSSSLFHYTSGGIEAIKGIINNGFRVTYCRELNPFSIGTFGVANGAVLVNPNQYMGSNVYLGLYLLHVPMVCFCDIKFSTIGDHLNTYGYNDPQTGEKKAYAIGLTKSWGQQKGLNPVHYIIPGSNYTRRLASSYRSGPDLSRKEHDNPHTHREKYCPPIPIGTEPVVQDNKGASFPYTFLYSKVAQLQAGPNPYNPDKKITIQNFQDEKEWRYVPQDAKIIGDYEWRTFSVNRLYYDSINLNAQRAIKESLPYNPLTFDHLDISHILVSTNSEVKEVHDVLKDRYRNLSDEDMALLLSKVNSFENLSPDW